MIWEWTWHQDAMSGCVQNIVNTMVFVRFTVLRKFEFLMSREGFGFHFGRLLATMGSLFFVFEGTRKMLEFRRIFDECRRPREVQVRGVLRIIGAPTSPLGLSPKIEEEEKRRS